MVTLIIMDGFGLRKDSFGNAIKESGTPYLKKLMKKYPHTKLNASGEAVGLPVGQMGNSEVGHFTIGAGKVVYQDLMEINKDIESGEFGKRQTLINAMKYAEKSGRLHLMGLLSDGGVHSHIDHLFALLEESKKYDIKEVFIHAFLDGRDVPPDSAEKYLDMLNEKLTDRMHIASISGRIYAMDREQRYDRLQKAYDVLTTAKPVSKGYKQVLADSYSEGVYDEFVLPVLLDKNGVIKDGDSVIFFNYRTDRARELTYAFTDKNFDKFKTIKYEKLMFSPMEEYSKDFHNLNVIYPPHVIENNLAKIISDNGMKQYHISETTKYAHVTFFINGQIEKAYPGEERKLIETINSQNYEYYPEMRANEITTDALDAIASQKYDYVLINLTNLDMIGHTGNFEATKKAASCVDRCVYALALATLMAGGECVITADHGNGELMFDKEGNKITSHTTNPVPFILVTNKRRRLVNTKNAGLANIAPTILKLLGIDIPVDMEKALVK